MKILRYISKTIIVIANLCLLSSCVSESDPVKKLVSKKTDVSAILAPKKPISIEFKNYWYAGEAEINSYKLKQYRYGELREGTAMLVYVTEPFLKDAQVKADNKQSDNIPVLKLNSTKNYLTGIYPYSIMNSSFYPVHDNQHALKVTFSCQEWCGHVYAQLNNREKFEINSYSYFASEGDQSFKFDKTVLENELWNKIRIKPKDLPVGAIKIIPSLEFIRLSHKELKPYDASITLTIDNEKSTYSIHYPELQRTLTINFDTNFPYTIQSWSDTMIRGSGENAKEMVSSATRIKTIKSPYWKQGSNKYLGMRDTLGL